MDLNQAITKHAEWKAKFRSAISNQETLDAETISKDDCCESGKWLHGESKVKYGKFTSYSDCVSKHEAAFQWLISPGCGDVRAELRGQLETSWT